MLDLSFDAIAKFYEAPLQLKANGESSSSTTSGGRWSAPSICSIGGLFPREGARLPDAAERKEVRDPLRPDHPLLHEHRAAGAGRRGVPPTDRVQDQDRLPGGEEYIGICRQVCERLGLPFRPEVIRYLLDEEHPRRGVRLSACHPNDVLSRVAEICRYEGVPLRLDNELWSGRAGTTSRSCEPKMNGFQIGIFQEIDGMSRRQERIIRKMMILSLVVHIVVFVMGSAISPLFPTIRFSPPVIVELTTHRCRNFRRILRRLRLRSRRWPVPTLSARLPTDRPRPVPPRSSPPPQGGGSINSTRGSQMCPRRLLPAGRGRRGGSRCVTGRMRPRQGRGFRPSRGPGEVRGTRKHLGELEARVRGSGRPGVGFGKETEASMMFGGAGDSAGEPIPGWIREMIRKRVRDRLPELEGVYADAIRRNPDLGGKLLVRFRIDPAGRSRAPNRPTAPSPTPRS